MYTIYKKFSRFSLIKVHTFLQFLAPRQPGSQLNLSIHTLYTIYKKINSVHTFVQLLARFTTELVDLSFHFTHLMCSVQEAPLQLQPGHVSQWPKVKLLLQFHLSAEDVVGGNCWRVPGHLEPDSLVFGKEAEKGEQPTKKANHGGSLPFFAKYLL